MLMVSLLLQATAVLPITGFDVTRMPPRPDPCRTGGNGAGGEIVVCGKRARADRLVPLPPIDEPGLPPAEINLFGAAKAGLTTEQADVGGFPSNRVMVRLKIPL